MSAEKIEVNGISFSLIEMLIMEQLIKGVPYKVIAQHMDISVKTVEYYARNVLNKTHCSNTQELADFLQNKKKPPQKHPVSITITTSIIVGSSIIAAVVLGHYFFSQRPQIKVSVDYAHFKRNFLQRKVLEKQIEKSFNSQKGIRVVVIVGSGGSGKTTLARKILQNTDTNIIWEFNAENEDSLYNSFMDFAERLAITETSQTELQIIRGLDANIKKRRLVRLVSSILKQHKGWRLLFDNVDNMRDIDFYFPHSSDIWGNGDVIITTRNENIKNTNMIGLNQIIAIGTLNDEDQERLFTDILYDGRPIDKTTRKQVRQFLKKIPHMPLDISAAAYYLKNTRISFEDYEKIMTSKDLSQIQQRFLEDNVNYSRMRYGIISAILDDMTKNNPQNKELLLFMCLMDSQNIPKHLMRALYGTLLVDDFLYNLQKNSLIVDSSDSFSIHRSSQQITLDYIWNALSENEKKKMITKIVEYISSEKAINESEPTKLAVHLESCLRKINAISGVEQQKIALNIAIGDVFRNNLRFADALEHFKTALNLRGKCELPNDGLIELKIGEIYTAINKD